MNLALLKHLGRKCIPQITDWNQFDQLITNKIEDKRTGFFLSWLKSARKLFFFPNYKNVYVSQIWHWDRTRSPC